MTLPYSLHLYIRNPLEFELSIPPPEDKQKRNSFDASTNLTNDALTRLAWSMRAASRSYLQIIQLPPLEYRQIDSGESSSPSSVHWWENGFSNSTAVPKLKSPLYAPRRSYSSHSLGKISCPREDGITPQLPPSSRLPKAKGL